jgi:hypothetical protein
MATKLSAAQGAIIAAVIGAFGATVAALMGQLHFGPEGGELRYPVAVFDNLTKGAVEDATIDMNLPELAQSRSDSGGKHIFKLTKRLIGKSATLTVSKDGYQTNNEQLLSLLRNPAMTDT